MPCQRALVGVVVRAHLCGYALVEEPRERWRQTCERGSALLGSELQLLTDDAALAQPRQVGREPEGLAFKDGREPIDAQAAARHRERLDDAALVLGQRGQRGARCDRLSPLDARDELLGLRRRLASQLLGQPGGELVVAGQGCVRLSGQVREAHGGPLQFVVVRIELDRSPDEVPGRPQLSQPLELRGTPDERAPRQRGVAAAHVRQPVQVLAGQALVETCKELRPVEPVRQARQFDLRGLRERPHVRRGGDSDSLGAVVQPLLGSW